MTSDERCARIVGELLRQGVPCLIMGGHAVRFYGVERGTSDYDLAVADSAWAGLTDCVSRLAIVRGPSREGESWRPRDFRRYVVGSLEDGREERVEFWRHNHLLAPWDELFARRRIGRYSGAELPFLGLNDLVRSKETEREDDWRDIQRLEEIGDEERIGSVARPGGAVVLAELHSQRGFQIVQARSAFARTDDVEAALDRTRHPVAAAFLLPFRPAITLKLTGGLAIEAARDILWNVRRGNGRRRHERAAR